jgi:hypothetical protein
MIPPDSVRPQTVGWQCQIIVIGLMMGVLIFAGIAITSTPEANWNPPQFLTWFGLGFVGLLVVARSVVLGMVTGQQIQQVFLREEPELDVALAPVYLNRVVIGGALLEAPAFLNLVLFMVTHHWLNVIAAGVMLVLLAITFPSQLKFEEWVDRVQRDRM